MLSVLLTCLMGLLVHLMAVCLPLPAMTQSNKKEGWGGFIGVGICACNWSVIWVVWAAVCGWCQE